MFYNFSFFAKPLMDFIQLWRDDRALSKILCSTIPIPVHDLKIKVTDFEFFCVQSLQCQLLQSLWWIWIMFGMNGYKILKCFRKEKRVSGELPCPATGLIFSQSCYLFHFPENVTIIKCVIVQKQMSESRWACNSQYHLWPICFPVATFVIKDKI